MPEPYYHLRVLRANGTHICNSNSYHYKSPATLSIVQQTVQVIKGRERAKKNVNSHTTTKGEATVWVITGWRSFSSSLPSEWSSSVRYVLRIFKFNCKVFRFLNNFARYFKVFFSRHSWNHLFKSQICNDLVGKSQGKFSRITGSPWTEFIAKPFTKKNNIIRQKVKQNLLI